MSDIFERVSTSFHAQGLMHTLGASLQWEWQPSVDTTASAWYGYDRSSLHFANVNDAPVSDGDPMLGGGTYPDANRWWEHDRQRNHYAGANFARRIGERG